MSDAEPHHAKFAKLLDYLERIPAVDANDTPSRGFGTGEGGGQWWVKFQIDIDHDFAWETVQELAHVLNYLSLEERLAASFKPVSPPPYMNGGPEDFLSWVIEASDGLAPGSLADLLEGHLPKPVEDLAAWGEEEDGEDDDDDDGEDEDADEED